MSDDNGDSLDLLLDTITNTFGGILFIAMLIVVLVSMSQPRISKMSQDSEIPTKRTPSPEYLDDLEYQLASLQRAIKFLDRSWQESRTEEAREILDEVLRLEEQVATLTRAQDRLRQELEGHQERIEERKRTAENLERKSAQLDEVIRQLVRSIVQQREKSRVSGSSPALREADTAGLTVVLRYGKLYFPDQLDASGTRRIGINLDEMVVLAEKDDEIIITPNPAAGTDATDEQSVRRRFQSLPPARSPRSTHIVVCVWEDSFREFATIRRVLVELGYRYRLILAAPGNRIEERPGAKELVQ